MITLKKYIVEVTSDYNLRIKYNTFPAHIYSLLGIVEELVELEEVYTEYQNSNELLLEESGDLLFYIFRLIGNMNLTDDIVTDELEEYYTKINLGLYQTDFLQPVSQNFYSLRKVIGLTSGLFKKAERKNETKLSDKTINTIISHLDVAARQSLLLVYRLGFSPMVALEKNLEKRQERLKRYIDETNKTNNEKTSVPETKTVTEGEIQIKKANKKKDS